MSESETKTHGQRKTRVGIVVSTSMDKTIVVRIERLVTHPNVCRIFDVFEHRPEGAPALAFVTMELLAGESLAERLRRDGAPPPAIGASAGRANCRADPGGGRDGAGCGAGLGHNP